jgi:hypothetical protein
MSACCDKPFPWVSTGLTLWPWPFCLTDYLTLAISFEWYVQELWYFTWVFLDTNLPLGTNRFDLVTLTLKFDLHTFRDVTTVIDQVIWCCDLSIWPTFQKMWCMHGCDSVNGFATLGDTCVSQTHLVKNYNTTI